MSNIETGGPAFPQDAAPSWSDLKPGSPSMNLRQYAAIKLKVPNSGVEWLDDMIRQSLINDFAAKAMQGMLAATPHDYAFDGDVISEAAYEMADAMLKASAE